MLVASEEATSGSVMAKQLLISPLSSGSSQRRFCSKLPYLPQPAHKLLSHSVFIVGLVGKNWFQIATSTASQYFKTKANSRKQLERDIFDTWPGPPCCRCQAQSS
jgi:hypothetical protein